MRTCSEEILSILTIARATIFDAKNNLLCVYGSYMSLHHTSTGFP